ncbi:MAG: DMT family transporter [Bacteroidales bacterium]|nr:DMT family transporter [Bacteroidales bacterium]
MLQNHAGELAALAVAFFWTITALAFESASMKVGSLVVNILRILLGFLFLSFFTLIKRDLFFPTDAGVENWIWLMLSGFVGFFLGDLFLFKSYTIIGSRFAMLIMTTVPPITAILGRVFLNERLSSIGLLGMTLTFIGIALAIFSRDGDRPGLKLKLAPKGILFAFGGAMGQAGGLVLSKHGMGDYDPFAATQIRLVAGFISFTLLISLLRRWKSVFVAITDRKGMTGITIGSFFGPFLGVSFSLLSIKYIETGIASTIMAMVPILIIAPSVILFKQKVTFIEIIGALISITGIALLFIK